MENFNSSNDQLAEEPKSMHAGAGVRKPYLWVALWVMCLIIIAGGVWYFLARDKSLTPEDIMNLNKDKTVGTSTIPPELRKIIIENSSAEPDAKSTIPEDLKKIILEQSSVNSDSNANGTIPKGAMKAILDSSSSNSQQ